MSSSFLSAAERERWQRFPETMPQDDLAIYFLRNSAKVTLSAYFVGISQITNFSPNA